MFSLFKENITEIVLLLFLIIVFLQSGIDKVKDWTGNLSWLKGHFAQTPFKNSVPLLLGVLTIMELASAVLCGIGLVQMLMSGDKSFALYGVSLSCMTLFILLLGQRVAKDYDGARTIVIYLMPAIFLLYLLK